MKLTVCKAPKELRVSIDDSGLTWGARGILAYLLKVRPGSFVSVTNLAKLGHCRKYKIRTILEELIHNKYIKRIERVDRTGRHMTLSYTVFDRPYEATEEEKRPCQRA